MASSTSRGIAASWRATRASSSSSRAWAYVAFRDSFREDFIWDVVAFVVFGKLVGVVFVFVVFGMVAFVNFVVVVVVGIDFRFVAVIQVIIGVVVLVVDVGVGVVVGTYLNVEEEGNMLSPSSLILLKAEARSKDEDTGAVAVPPRIRARNAATPATCAEELFLSGSRDA